MTLDDLLSDLEHPFPVPPTDPEVLQDWLLEQQERLTVQIGAAMEALAGRFLNEFIDSLAAAGDYTLISTFVGGWTALADTAFGNQLIGMYTSGAVEAILQKPGADLAADLLPPQWAQLVNQNAVDYREQTIPRIVNAGQDTLQEVQNLTLNKLRTGQDPRQLRADIQQTTGFARSRAETIARTEVVGAYNNGNMAGARALGEAGPVKKEWSAVDQPGRTRETHLEADGQTVWFDEPFIVGGEEMDAPHDPKASAEETINCRCQVILLYEGDQDRDGNVVERRSSAEGSTDDETLEWQPTQPDFDLTVDHSMRLDGAHEKAVLVDSQGNRYLFKPADDVVVRAEIAANRIQQLAGLETPQMYLHEVNGRLGSLQRLELHRPQGSTAKQVVNIFDSKNPDFSGFGPFQAGQGKVTIEAIQQHRVLDWALGNHDGHARQFVRGRQGPMGIDKGQAWKYHGKDRLDWRYHPNSAYGEAPPIANLLEQAIVEGRFRGNVPWVGGNNAVTETARRIQAIPDAEYRAILRPYAEARWGAGSPQANQFLVDMVARKNSLVADFTAYHNQLKAARPAQARAAAPQAPKVGAAPGAPKGMPGARASVPDTAFFTETDHPLLPGQKGVPSFRSYTGDNFIEMNGWLRGVKSSLSTELQQHIATMKAAMKTVKDDIVVYRGTQLEKYLPPGMSMSQMEGTVLRDRAFWSSSAGTKGAAFTGDTQIIIRANKGVARGRWVQEISKFSWEREFLLDADQAFFVHAVRAPTVLEAQRWKSGYKYVLEVEVVSKEWLRKQGNTPLRVWDSNKQALVSPLDFTG